VTVDHVHAADLTVVVGLREVAATHGTETAVVATPIAGTVATARRVDLAAAATTKVARVVVTEAARPTVAIVRTVKMRNRKPRTEWITMRTTVKRQTTVKHRSHHNQQKRRTTRLNEKAVPQLMRHPKMILRARLLNRLEVAAAPAAVPVAVATRQMTRTKVGCCQLWSSNVCSGVFAVDISETGRYLKAYILRLS